MIALPPPTKKNKLRRYPQQHRTLPESSQNAPGPTLPPVLLRMPPCNFRKQRRPVLGLTAQLGPDRGPTVQSAPSGARRCNRAPTGARWSCGASGPPPTPATHIIAQRRFSLGCGLTIVSSKTRRCQLGTVDRARRRNAIGPRQCNRAPTWAR